MLRYFLGFLIGVLSLAVSLPLFEQEERVPYCSELFYRQVNDYRFVDLPLVGQLDLGDGQVVMRWAKEGQGEVVFYDLLIVRPDNVNTIGIPDDSIVVSSLPCVQNGQSYLVHIVTMTLKLADGSF